MKFTWKSLINMGGDGNDRKSVVENVHELQVFAVNLIKKTRPFLKATQRDRVAENLILQANTEVKKQSCEALILESPKAKKPKATKPNVAQSELKRTMSVPSHKIRKINKENREKLDEAIQEEPKLTRNPARKSMLVRSAQSTTQLAKSGIQRCLSRKSLPKSASYKELINKEPSSPYDHKKSSRYCAACSSKENLLEPKSTPQKRTIASTLASSAKEPTPKTSLGSLSNDISLGAPQVKKVRVVKSAAKRVPPNTPRKVSVQKWETFTRFTEVNGGFIDDSFNFGPSLPPSNTAKIIARAESCVGDLKEDLVDMERTFQLLNSKMEKMQIYY